MSTYVFFHAHPDDEAIITAGTMVLAKQRGHRTVLVVATAGEEGEVEEGFELDGASLGEVRVRELEAAAAILGVDRVEVLGYRDSGMMGTAANGHEASFWSVDVGAAARRLAAILSEEGADVLTIYDDNGGYGHPDHIQVHRVGRKAAELAGTPRVLEATFDREVVTSAAPTADVDMDGVGKPAALITTAVDVSSVLATKREAMRAHPSQIPEDSWFLSMDEVHFAALFGTEWYIQTRPRSSPRAGGSRESWLD